MNLTGLIIQAAALACLCLAETSCEFMLRLYHFLFSGQSLQLKVQFAARRSAVAAKTIAEFPAQFHICLPCACVRNKYIEMYKGVSYESGANCGGLKLWLYGTARYHGLREK